MSEHTCLDVDFDVTTGSRCVACRERSEAHTVWLATREFPVFDHSPADVIRYIHEGEMEIQARIIDSFREKYWEQNRRCYERDTTIAKLKKDILVLEQAIDWFVNSSE